LSLSRFRPSRGRGRSRLCNDSFGDAVFADADIFGELARQLTLVHGASNRQVAKVSDKRLRADDAEGFGKDVEEAQLLLLRCLKSEDGRTANRNVEVEPEYHRQLSGSVIDTC
jgi:hypothetical protein